MPGDRFAFAVRVGREVDARGVFRFLLQLCDDLAAAADGDVLHLEIVIRIHAELGLGQIAHVPLRRRDLVPLAQEFFYGFRFGGRFHDHQFLFRCCRCHCRSSYVLFSG